MSYRDPYFDKPGVSSHALADFRRRGPLFYYRKHVQKVIPDQDSEAYAFGRAVHCLTLEGDAAFARRFVVAPTEHLTPSGELSSKKDTKAWLSEQGNVDIITPNDARAVAGVAKASRAHPEVARLLASGRAEVEKYSTHRTGLALKGKADWCCANGDGLDLKTCWNLDEFRADALKYGYAEQMAFYRMLFGWDRVHLVAVEKAEPFRVRVFRLTDACLTAAAQRNDAALVELAHRKDLDDWSEPVDVIDLDLSVA